MELPNQIRRFFDLPDDKADTEECVCDRKIALATKNVTKFAVLVFRQSYAFTLLTSSHIPDFDWHMRQA